MPVVIFLSVVTMAGLLLTTGQVLLVTLRCRADRNNKRDDSTNLESRSTLSRSADPTVSILKPVSGLEDGLEQNLESFANLSGVSYEVIFSVADRSDPALEVIQKVIARFPDAPFRLVIGGVMRGLVANPKVERLIAASRLARGAIYLISDSNVRVSSRDLEGALKPFDDPHVGLTSDMFLGCGARTVGSIIESLHLMTYVLPGSVLAHWAGAVCVVGKSMAIRREVCEEIGGFEAFSNVLAEDQAMGIAVRNAGYRIGSSSVIVQNVTETRSLKGAINRQIRWGKIRYSFSRILYVCEFAFNPLPLALVALAAALAFGRSGTGPAMLFLSAVGIRLFQTFVLRNVTQSQLPLRHVLLSPIQDLIQFAGQLVPLCSSEVNWRGHRARLGRGTLMLVKDAESRTQSSLTHKPA